MSWKCIGQAPTCSKFTKPRTFVPHISLFTHSTHFNQVLCTFFTWNAYVHEVSLNNYHLTLVVIRTNKWLICVSRDRKMKSLKTDQLWLAPWRWDRAKILVWEFPDIWAAEINKHFCSKSWTNMTKYESTLGSCDVLDEMWRFFLKTLMWK